MPPVTDNNANTASGTNGALDVSACEREPVHIPGRVQPHGALLGLSEPDLTILQASANAEPLLGQSAGSLVGRPLDVLLEAEPVERLREALLCKHVTLVPLRLFTVRVRGCDAVFDATAHCGGDVQILELEPQPPPPPAGTPDLNYLLKTGFPRLAQADSLVTFCQAAAQLVRRITGFDRVMLYRFDAQWNGEVIAEDRRSDWEPYLGLRYPASDIPRQAREMYLKNALRLIADVHAAPQPLVPVLNSQTGAPLDMTHAILRSVSPIHIEYLQNMGVGASMSVAITRRGALWGLIACHHETARYVPYDVRNACEILGQVVSLLVPEKEASGQHEHAVRLKAAQIALVGAMSSARDVLRGLADATPGVADYLGAGGAVICLDGQCVLQGRTPDEAAVRDLVAWLSQQASQGDRSGDAPVYVTETLARQYPPAGAWPDVASGLLAVSLSRGADGNWLLWFRPEIARTVNWAGDPHKRVQMAPDGTERLSPRKSFALWQESVRGEALAWKPAELQAARDLQRAITGLLLQQAEARRVEDARRAAYEREKRIAETLQQSLLTPPPREGFPGLGVAARYEAAASAEANVGGDFYDAFALPTSGRVLLCVGDVTGKGLQAAQHIMAAKFALRALAMEHDGDPGECLTRLNALHAATQAGDVSSLIALALVVVTPETGQALVAIAGAEPPLLVRPGGGGAARTLTAGNLALGVLPDTVYVSEPVHLDREETLVLMTDGLTEARRGRGGDFFGPEGVADVAARTLASGQDLAGVGAAVVAEARAFAGGRLQDDICLLLAKRR